MMYTYRFSKHAFENLEESAKDGIISELLGQGPAIFGEVAKSQWGSYCIQHSTLTDELHLVHALILSKFLNMVHPSIAI